MNNDDIIDSQLMMIERAGEELASDHEDCCPLHDVGSGIATAARELRVERELAAGSGPAQVATKVYRDGWDTIFGNRRQVGQA